MKKPRLPYLVIRKAKGKEYCYYERGKERISLPHYSKPEFDFAYAEAKAGRTQPKANNTWAGLIDRYRRDDKFTRKSARTREDYDRVMAYLRDTIGELDPARMTTPTIYQMLDANRERYRFANYVVQVMSILLGFAKKIGWVQFNAAAGVEKLTSDGPDMHRPWSEHTSEEFLKHACPRARLVYELVYGTGQRIGDVLELKWDDIVDGEFHIAQNKTDAALVIPMTGQLRSYLAAVDRKGVYILARSLRYPLSYKQAWGAVSKALKAAGVHGTIHGLRYTVAAEMAEQGASDEEIAAITGHESLAMVKKYAGAARQKARARSAQKRRG